MRAVPGRFLPACAGALACALAASAGDQPQWGAAWSRNLASAETNLPVTFDPASGLNVKWTARLGTETHSSPIVAGGKVYVGTNNGRPRDARHEGDRGVLMCFNEQTGAFLWQLLVPKRTEDIFFDWPNSGICSPPTVESNRVYVVNNRGEVMCLDAEGMANGNDGPFKEEAAHRVPQGRPPEEKIEPGPADADVLWLFKLTTGAGIWSHDAAHSSILIHGDYLYLNSGTGVDNTHRAIRTPDAPALVVLDKRTGALVARDREGMAPNTFHSTWSPPSMGSVGGQLQVFFAGGNGFVYGFAPVPADAAPVATVKKLWQFDFDPGAPKEQVHKYNSNRRESPSNFFGMPVFHEGRLYVAGGGDIWWGKNEAWLKCIDPAAPEKLVWSYALRKHVMGTPVPHQGLVYLADCGRALHCVDAQTGKACWVQEIDGDAWASPLVADGKVYLGTRTGAFYVMAAGREQKLLSSLKLDKPISATATAANGVLYVATMSHLYALRTGAVAPAP